MPSQTYNEWQEDFAKGKQEVPSTETRDSSAVHSIRRWVDGSGNLLETALTYTGRLVLRKGEMAADGIEVVWNAWITMHEVKLT
jgi:hypothetical protein